MSGLKKAADSGYISTAVYSSGIQVSGMLGAYRESGGEPAYLQFTSETSLSVNGKQLAGHGKEYHAHGFGSPVGRIRGASVPPEALTPEEIAQFAGTDGITLLEFNSGIRVSGRVERILNEDGKVMLITFSGCTVTLGEEVLFRPEWGMYDMAVGERIVSVFPGPADPTAWGLSYPELKEKTHKIVHTPEEKRLHGLYQAVRDLREKGKSNGALTALWKEISGQHPGEWLLPLEILEMAVTQDQSGLRTEIMEHLARIKSNPEFAKLVDDGLYLLNQPKEP